MYPIHATLDKYNRPKTYQMSTQNFPNTNTYYSLDTIQDFFLKVGYVTTYASSGKCIFSKYHVTVRPNQN